MKYLHSSICSDIEVSRDHVEWSWFVWVYDKYPVWECVVKNSYSTERSCNSYGHLTISALYHINIHIGWKLTASRNMSNVLGLLNVMNVPETLC